jgi:hypothetical protein
MTSVTIKTNHAYRNLVYRADVPEAVLTSQFDYQDPEETLDGFFQYRGQWYHLDGFMRVVEGNDALSAWDGYASDSAFSGVLIKLSRDGERVMVGTYYS